MLVRAGVSPLTEGGLDEALALPLVFGVFAVLPVLLKVNGISRLTVQNNRFERFTTPKLPTLPEVADWSPTSNIPGCGLFLNE